MSLRIKTENVLSPAATLSLTDSRIVEQINNVAYGPLPEKFKGANWQGAWKQPTSPMLAFRDGENTSAAKEPKDVNKDGWHVSGEVRIKESVIDKAKREIKQWEITEVKIDFGPVEFKAERKENGK